MPKKEISKISLGVPQLVRNMSVCVRVREFEAPIKK